MKGTFFYSALLVIVFCTFLPGCKTAPVKEDSIQQLIRSGKTQEASQRFQFKYDINSVDQDGNTALHAAAEVNATDLVTRFILVGANTELKNLKGETALHVAIKSGSIESAQILAAVGGNLFARNGDGTTALDMGLAADPRYYDIFITTKSGEIRDTDGETIVHYFVKTGNEKAVQYCIKKNLPISVKDTAGKTPLDVAFDNINNNDTAVQIAADLIMGGAEQVNSPFSYFQTAVSNRNLDYRFEDGQTPLHLSAIMGHSGIVKYLLENSAKTNVQDSSGATPLHEAVRYGHTDIAAQLLDAGADVNAEDNLGKTPITLVIPDNARESLYSLLISHKANVKQKDMYGDTVLHTAEMINLPIALIQQLVDGGADINARNKEGVTPLILAIEKKNLDHIKFYADNGADINSEDKNGRTPLTLALKTDNLLESIVNKNNVLFHDSAGNTPLHVAILNDSSLEKIQYILSMMSDVNARNSDGNTALYLAVVKNRQKLGELLLAKNADIFSANNQNYSPLRLALKTGGTVQDWLITSQTIKATDGSGNTALHYAAEWEMKDAVASLLEKGANPSAANANGETPIFNGVKTNDTALISQMVAGGCSLQVRDHLGSTPLHVAVRWNAEESAKYLIMHGVDINAQNLSGKSALAEAVIGGNTSMAKMLLENGANVNVSDSTGRTILMDAIRSESLDTITLLLKNGANPQIQEINGRNAYHEAAFTGNTEVITLIRNAGGNPLSRDKTGNTPFSLTLGRDAKVIRAVLGTDVTIADSDGNTPVHIIVQNNGADTILKLLVDNGYPVDTRNAAGYTPLSFAVEQNYEPKAQILLADGANPFLSIDKNDKNAAIIALTKNNDAILADIVKYAGTKSDIQGNTILHYAARMSDPDTIKKLLSFGLDPAVKNISGETPYQTAIRWKRSDAAAALQPAAK
jgi:uncharacterized protein